MFEGNQKDHYQEHITDDTTRPWPRPGDFFRIGVESETGGEGGEKAGRQGTLSTSPPHCTASQSW